MATTPGPRTPGRRVRMTRDARREQLLDAAAGIVVEHGSDALTMESVALAAGASKTLGYAYFENISDLVLSLYQREAGTLAVAVTGAVGEHAAFADRLRAIARAYIGQMAEKGPLLVALSGGITSGQFGLRGQRPFDDVLTVLADVIDEEYGVGEPWARGYARLFGALATIHAEMLWTGAIDRAEAEDHLERFIMGGIQGVQGR